MRSHTRIAKWFCLLLAFAQNTLMAQEQEPDAPSHGRLIDPPAQRRAITAADEALLLRAPKASEPLTATLKSLDSQNFPFIYMNVAVDTFGQGFPGLQRANFTVHENDVLQTDYFDVVPPEQGGGVRLADVVFLMDNSGSMDDEIAAVSNNVFDFVNALSSSGVDFALGLCRFGGYENSGNPIIEDNGILTTDAGYFKDTIWKRNYANGVKEPGYYALVESARGFSFRPGAQKIFIIITDEHPDQGGATQAQALALLTGNKITLFALTEAGLFSYFAPLTTATNGQYFNIYSPFDQILRHITSQVSNSYVISYRSSNPAFDDARRNVRVRVTYGAEADTATGAYIPGAAPVIHRTATTLALHERAQIEGQSLLLAAEIVDNVAPQVQEARMYYKRTGATTFSSVVMTRQSGNVYRASIPGSAVAQPGVDYYLKASDGVSTSTDPRTNPESAPYQIAILPNEAPEITHTPVTSLTPSRALTISAEIVDRTNSLSSAKLFYRKTGQLLYQQREMSLNTGNQYVAAIPVDYVTSAGVDYYLVAEDNFGVRSTHGSADVPHVIAAFGGFAVYLTEKQSLITDILNIQRPFHGRSHPFYESIEIEARGFVDRVETAHRAGTADPVDLEAVARLTLSERVTKQAAVDAVEISAFGAKGVRAYTTGKIFEFALRHLATIVKSVPFIGKAANSALNSASEKIANSLERLLMAFHNGLKDPAGQLSLLDLLRAQQELQKALLKADTRLAVETATQLDQNIFKTDLFETADHLIQDYVYLSVFEFQTQGRQRDAVENAKLRQFPAGDFSQAEGKASQRLRDMANANQTAKAAGNFLETVREQSKNAVLIGAFILIVVGIAGAVFSGGTSLLAALAGLAAFLIKWGSFVSGTAALTEAAGAAVHVNAVIPYGYLNPSVNDAFGATSQLGKHPLTLKQSSGSPREFAWDRTTHAAKVQNYYFKLRDMVQSNDPAWATTGMDSLNYYEGLARQEEEFTTAQWFAASDSAGRVIASYRAMTSNYFARAAAREIFSASLDLSALVYHAGLMNAEARNSALAALDTTIVNYEKLNEVRAAVYDSLADRGIPIRTAVGIGEISVRKSPRSPRNILLTAEVVNYGPGLASGIEIYPYLATPEAVVHGDTLQTFQLRNRETALAEFEIAAADTSLSGVMLLRANSAPASYYVLPGKSFSMNLPDISPATPGALNNQNVYAYPNPFNPANERAKLRFRLERDGEVSITIYDAGNVKVREVTRAVSMLGGVEQSVEWDGRDERGELVANGAYFYVIESSAGEKAIGKVAVLR